MEVTKDFKVIIKEKYSENIYIQYDSLYQYHELGQTAEDSRIIFEKFANKVVEGQIYLVLPSPKGLIMIMSEKGALTVGFDNDGSINSDNYLQLLDEQGAIGYIIEFKHDLIVNAIQKDLLKIISDYAYQEYLKVNKKEPEKIYIKLSSEGGKNIITNHKPDSDVMMYFYDINFEKKNINNKINELKTSLLSENPDLVINFDYLMTDLLEKENSESYFEKINLNNKDDEQIEKSLIEDINEEKILILEEENRLKSELTITEVEENKYYEKLFQDIYSEQNEDGFNEEDYILTDIH